MIGRFGVRHRVDIELIGFLWEERTAIAEFDGGLSRAEAEGLAWREIDGLLALIECGSGKSPAGSGVTSQWLPPPPSHHRAEMAQFRPRSRSRSRLWCRKPYLAPKTALTATCGELGCLWERGRCPCRRWVGRFSPHGSRDGSLGPHVRGLPDSPRAPEGKLQRSDGYSGRTEYMQPSGVMDLTGPCRDMSSPHPKCYAYPNSHPLRGCRFTRALALSLSVNLPSRKS